MKDDLKDRVQKFSALSLPGQPHVLHMGTSYLVSDLVEEIKRLETEIEALREDAERYRWLRYRMTSAECDKARNLTGVALDRNIDAAIDAARGKK